MSQNRAAFAPPPELQAAIDNANAAAEAAQSAATQSATDKAAADQAAKTAGSSADNSAKANTALTDAVNQLKAVIDQVYAIPSAPGAVTLMRGAARK